MAAGSAEGLKKLLAAEDFPPRRKPGSGEEELLPAESLSDFPPRRKPGSEELLPAAAAEEGEGGLPAAVDDPFPTLPPSISIAQRFRLAPSTLAAAPADTLQCKSKCHPNCKF